MGLIIILVVVVFFVVLCSPKYEPKKQLAKEISKSIEYKLENPKYHKFGRIYVRAYDDLIVQLEYVGFSYAEVTIWKNCKKIASWTYEEPDDVFEFKCYEPLFTYETMKLYFISE